MYPKKRGICASGVATMSTFSLCPVSAMKWSSRNGRGLFHPVAADFAHPRYRVLLRLEAIERVFERERPDLIESGDPYQCAWKAVHSGAARGIPGSDSTDRTFRSLRLQRAKIFR